MTNHFFIIKKDGIYSRTETEEYIGPQSSLLETLAKRTPMVIPGIAAGISVAVTTEGMALAGRLEPNKLMLSTHFRPITDTKENVFLVPVWAAQKTPASAEHKLEWIPPDGMVLWFVTAWECKDADPTGHTPKCYLLARDAQDMRYTYLLPMPNLYEDGRICMGDSFRPSGNVPGKQYDIAVKSFMSTDWNNHLIGNAVNSQEMFKFDGNGKQVAPTKNWRELCKKTSHPNYAFIVKLT